jgi:C-terminal processing protease CtpA/Prc
MQKAIQIIAIFFLLSLTARGQVILHTINLDFEDGSPGNSAFGWYIPGYAEHSGYYGYLTDIEPAEGRLSYELVRDSILEDHVAPYGSVMQSVEAEPYLGKRVLLRAAIKAEITSDSGSAHLWIREHLIHDQDGHFDMMEDSPIVVNFWDHYEIEAEISPYAKQINFGLVLIGTGRAWIDDVSLTILEDESEITPPMALSEQSLRNLKAFADIYGHIRYFYAGMEARKIDWTEFALDGVRYIENAKDDSELLEKLNELFMPIAPALTINDKTANRKFNNKPENALDNIALGWMHKGPPIAKGSEYLYSKVVNVLMPIRESEGVALQVINAKDIKGKSIEIDVAVKADVVEPFSHAQIWLRADNEQGQILKAATSAENPIKSNKWQRYQLAQDIPENTSVIQVGLVLAGDGKCYFDDAKINVIENGQKAFEIPLRNGDFEDPTVKRAVPQWRIVPKSQEAGYEAYSTNKESFEGNQSLIIESDKNTLVTFPKVGQMYDFTAGDIFKCSYPLNLYVDSVTTLPHPEAMPKEISNNGDYSTDDRYSRLATVVLLGNIYHHFNLFSDQKKLDAAIKKALSKAAQNRNKEDFLVTLQQLTACLNDGQARCWHPDLTQKYELPFAWVKIGKEIIITKVDDKIEKEIKPGTIVNKLNGKAIASVLDSVKTLISGSTERWKDIRALALLRSGINSESMIINCKLPNGKTLEKKIKKERYVANLSDTRPPKFDIIDSGYFYVDLTRLDDEDFKKNFKPLVGAKGIVFDVRGEMLSTEHILGFFIDRPVRSCKWHLPVYTMPDKKMISNNIITNDIVPKPYLEECKTVFLANERTIGYGEAMLALVDKYNIGEIIGARTAGTAGEHTVFRLPGNYYVSMTVIEVIKPDGKEIHKEGIKPTIEIKPKIKEIIDQNDEIYERAKKIIKK